MASTRLPWQAFIIHDTEDQAVGKGDTDADLVMAHETHPWAMGQTALGWFFWATETVEDLLEHYNVIRISAFLLSQSNYVFRIVMFTMCREYLDLVW